MQTISYPTKVTGDELTAADVNEVKTVVNANAVDVYKQLFIPAYLMHPDTDDPTEISVINDIPVLKFYPTSDKCHFLTQLPLDYKSGSDLSLKLVAVATSENTGAEFVDEYVVDIYITNTDADTVSADKILAKFSGNWDAMITTPASAPAKSVLTSQDMDYTGTNLKPGAIIGGNVVLSTQSSPIDPHTIILGLVIEYISDHRGKTS
jgi:hypothetical protein